MKTVLIVEDEKMIRQGIKTMVQRSGIPVEIIMECNNGQMALEILQNQQVDVMFTDIRMPKMDGIELVSQIQKLPAKPLVVVISGYDDFSYAVEMLTGYFSWWIELSLKIKLRKTSRTILPLTITRLSLKKISTIGGKRRLSFPPYKRLCSTISTSVSLSLPIFHLSLPMKVIVPSTETAVPYSSIFSAISWD